MSRTSASRRERGRFLRHFAEMCAAMVAGMVVFGALVQLLCALSGHGGLLDHPGASGPIMATNMTVGMTVGMKHRGHGWAATGEMAAAMYLPLLVLLVPFWTGLISDGAFLGATHVLMLPAMFVTMLHRRAEYVQDHHSEPAERPLAQAL